jgi:hypothetical protein
MHSGPDVHPYMSNIPPWEIFISELISRGYVSYANTITEVMKKNGYL